MRRHLFAISAVLIAAPANATDCPADAGPLASFATAVESAAALTSAPSPVRFANAWTKAFAKAVRDGDGVDGRLSLNEAKKLPAPWGDNAVNFLLAEDQQSVDTDKLISRAWKYAFANAKKVAGEDGRVSLADGEKLPADLRADYLTLRGKLGGADHLRAKVESTVDGLIYMSETDSRIAFVEGGAPGSGAISAGEVKAAFGALHDQIFRDGTLNFPDPDYVGIGERFAEVRDAQEYLDDLATIDDPSDPMSVENAQRFGQLRDLLKGGLTDLTVIRFNQQEGATAITSSIFIVGRRADGTLAGVTTFSVET